MRLIRFFAIFIACLGSVDLHAQTVPPSCDVDFYNVLGARAKLAGSREMEAAQRIIRKPDSTLEYSCFGRYVLDHLAVTTNFLFSDDIDRLSMDVSLRDLILRPMNRYLDDNFWHVYLGGAFVGFGGGPLCDAMSQVWNAAKCQDANAGFLMFNEMITNDPRTLPVGCVFNAASAADRNAYMTAMMAAAFPVPGALGAMNILDTFQPEMSSCATPPVETGLRVTLSAGAPFADAVCIAPGCYYDGRGACRP